MTNTTRKHPRTLNEAFGPYHDRSPIFDPPGPRSRASRIIDALFWIAGFLMFCAAVFGALL